MREPGTLADHPVWQDHAPLPFSLVLEGGAMRCQFTAGVLDCMLDRGVIAQAVVGVSAGAAVGFSYASGATGRSCYMNMKYASDWRFFSLRSRIETGSAYGGRFIFDTIPNELEHIDYTWFGESPVRFTSAASCLEDGRAAYHEFYKGMEVKRGSDYLIASTSMPLVSAPVEIEAKHYLDGGVCDNVPFAYALAAAENRGASRASVDTAAGTGKLVAILSKPRGHRWQPSRLAPLVAARYRAFPRFVEAYGRRHLMCNDQYRELERMHDNGQAFVVWPAHPVPVRLMEKDPDRLLAAWAQGYKQMALQWDALERYLAT